MKKQQRASRAVWEGRIAQWKESGQSASGYARSIGVHPKTFSYWRWRIAQDDPGDSGESQRTRVRRGSDQPKTSPSFLELVAPVDVAASERIELILPSGVRVQVPPSFEADALRRVIGVLGGA